MDLPALYEEDMHAWCHHQAAVLRRLKASGLPLPNDLDLDHVAEEIEDLGNEQRVQVEGNLERAIEHLLKLALRPEDPAEAHRRREVIAFLDAAQRRYARSMRQAIDPARLWRRGCRLASAQLGDERGRIPDLPPEMPFTLDDLLDEDADPRALALRLAAAMGAP